MYAVIPEKRIDREELYLHIHTSSGALGQRKQCSREQTVKLVPDLSQKAPAPSYYRHLRQYALFGPVDAQ